MKAKAKEAAPREDEEEQEIAEELSDATDETPTEVTAPEIDARTEALTEWDEAPTAHGTAAPKVGPEEDEDGEDTIAAKLVYEGTDEAERERRIAAADPDFEP